MAGMDASAELERVAGEYWEAKLAAGPIWASYLGDHRYEDQVDDLSAEGEQALRSTWSTLRDRAAAVAVDGAVGGLSATERVTRALLIEELDDNIRAIDLRLRELMSDQMQGVHVDLLLSAGELRVPSPEHAPMALERTRRFGRMLDQAAQRYREGLAAGRTPARVNVERSMNQVAKYLASPLATDPFVNVAGPEGWDGAGHDAWRAALGEAVTAELRPAYARYHDVLRDELLPAARPDDRCGLVWLDDGPELYAALIESHTGLALDPAELHERGLAEVTEALPAEYVAAGARAFGSTDLATIFDRLVNDAGLRYRDREEMLDHVNATVDAAKAAAGGWFGRLPRTECVVVPIPGYLEADATLASYSPPPTDGSRPGQYNVNLHGADRRSRAVTATTAFHEAIPGHHLQLALSNERTELPAFRRLSLRHSAFMEGWALYAERLAGEMGLFATEVDRLGMLANESWRACRLVVDTGLHTLGWSRQRAIDFMVDHVPVGRDDLVVDVDRYIGWPAQALAYKVGQHAVLDLRRRAEAGLGPDFDLAAFHDSVLGEGSVSLGVLRTQVALGG
jgi:uncharacterized protein (DUF885 family)